MRRAVELAERGRATTLPNPVVGAVVLDPDGNPVGEGWHERAGGPHAEVRALQAAGERAWGATLVVTLEPCAHTGRTGPCVDAIVAAGVRRVVLAVPDPTELAGGGAERLRAAGIEVESGLLAEQAEEGNEPWLVATRLRRVFVTWKLATTLDGRAAAADGTSRWITGDAARADVHRLRAECDAIAVGVGTVLADDPWLTVRDAGGDLAERQPLRVVVDSRGRTPAGARVRDAAAATWLATAEKVGAGPTGQVDLRRLVDRLYADGRRHLFLEGGPRLAGGFVATGLVDRVVAYVAPALLGSGPSVLAEAGIASIAGIRRLEITDVTRLGPDLRVTARPARPG
jgi:diaminohydroxyphosphoribosylaminopyrimidine deaminase/5-amino-6-(5-phosphoribosylamino)uracil reductase